ncbi:Hypothetical predicted protein [Xyrichtys novacula]|uniref:Uncharacterized protein n=1 Tax=Xyrichtys novacula TaxID=13765 RepID=A0AAV1FRB3_XYRNO|nr:Hypothetical predicted protein [Xyrichtys novacula]
MKEKADKGKQVEKKRLRVYQKGKGREEETEAVTASPFTPLSNSGPCFLQNGENRGENGESSAPGTEESNRKLQHETV